MSKNKYVVDTKHDLTSWIEHINVTDRSSHSGSWSSKWWSNWPIIFEYLYSSHIMYKMYIYTDTNLNKRIDWLIIAISANGIYQPILNFHTFFLKFKQFLHFFLFICYYLIANQFWFWSLSEVQVNWNGIITLYQICILPSILQK